MVKWIFKALRSRFLGSHELRRVGRELFLGFNEQRLNVVPPYTEVNITKVRDLGTFEGDAAQWDLRFRYKAKDIQTDSAADWMEAMQDTFKDAELLSGHFSCAGLQSNEEGAPTLGNATFQASARFTLYAERLVNLPVTRGV